MKKQAKNGDKQNDIYKLNKQNDIYKLTGGREKDPLPK